MQIVFQDPYASLNPRMTIRQILSEKYQLLGAEVRRSTIGDLLDTVGLAEEYADRYPHEFSGGQRQRRTRRRAAGSAPAAGSSSSCPRRSASAVSRSVPR